MERIRHRQCTLSDDRWPALFSAAISPRPRQYTTFLGSVQLPGPGDTWANLDHSERSGLSSKTVGQLLSLSLAKVLGGPHFAFTMD